MNWKMESGLGVLLGFGLILGCSDTTGLEERTEVSFLVQPQTVVSGGDFVAVLLIKNVSGEGLTLTSGQSCISLLSVHEAPWGDPVRGTDFSCLDVITDFPIRAGGEMSWEWDLKAETSTGVLLDPGDYHLQAELNVLGLDHPTTTFEVSAGG